jgi:hypothetical protein
MDYRHSTYNEIEAYAFMELYSVLYTNILSLGWWLLAERPMN